MRMSRRQVVRQKAINSMGSFSTNRQVHIANPKMGPIFLAIIRRFVAYAYSAAFSSSISVRMSGTAPPNRQGLGAASAD